MREFFDRPAVLLAVGACSSASAVVSYAILAVTLDAPITWVIVAFCIAVSTFSAVVSAVMAVASAQRRVKDLQARLARIDAVLAARQNDTATN